MNEIIYMGIKFGDGEFNNIDELNETYIEVKFSHDSMKQFNGNCLVIRHYNQSILILDEIGNLLFESAIIEMPFFKQELLTRLKETV